MREYINPVTGAKQPGSRTVGINPRGPDFRTMSRPFSSFRRGTLDFDAFTGMPGVGANAGFRGVEKASRRTASAVAGMAGSLNRNTAWASKTFNAFGRKTTYGRAAVSGGLGFLALRNGANMMDRMRYGDYGGAMMSGALTAAAGYGAYKSMMLKGSMRNSINTAIGKGLQRAFL